MTAVADQYLLPQVFQCLNPTCTSGYLSEYLRQKATESSNCPHCKIPGSHKRYVSTQKAVRHQCGMCERIFWLGENEWPVGDRNWGFIQLYNHAPFKYVCVECTTKLALTYPCLNDKNTHPSTVERELPKIVRASQMEIDDGRIIDEDVALD